MMVYNDASTFLLTHFPQSATALRDGLSAAKFLAYAPEWDPAA